MLLDEARKLVICSMELESEASSTETPSEKLFNISCNWKITNNKSFYNAITVEPFTQTSNRVDLDDVVSLDTCVSLAATDEGEPCMLEIKNLTNKAISRVAVVSECSVLEFFKQCGEYATTVFAEFVDDFDGSSPVYIAETAIVPPSTEASIKFTKMKSKGSTMWVYGIKLYLTEIKTTPKTDGFNYDVIKGLLSNQGERSRAASVADKMLKALTITNDSMQQTAGDQNYAGLGEFLKLTERSKRVDRAARCTNCASGAPMTEDIKKYIDAKLSEMETRLSQKMTEIEQKTNRNLEAILTKLDLLIDKKTIAHS